MFIKRTEKHRAAVTLVEMMVALAIGSILLMVIANFIVYTARAFASMANYAELEYNSRNCLDRLTSRIRAVKGLYSFTSNELVFVDADINGGQFLTYTYIPAEQRLYYKDFENGSYTPRTCLLSNISELTFDIYQRNTISDSYEQYNTATNATEAKIAQVYWKCSKKLYGTALFNTEVVQTAKIVIRTK